MLNTEATEGFGALPLAVLMLILMGPLGFENPMDILLMRGGGGGSGTSSSESRFVFHFLCLLSKNMWKILDG